MTTSNVTEPANPTAVAEQTTMGEAPGVTRSVIEGAAQVSEQAACANADGLTHATETARDTFQASLNPATQSFQPITDQVTQVLGLRSETVEQTRRKGRPDHRPNNLVAESEHCQLDERFCQGSRHRPGRQGLDWV